MSATTRLQLLQNVAAHLVFILQFFFSHHSLSLFTPLTASHFHYKAVKGPGLSYLQATVKEVKK